MSKTNAIDLVTEADQESEQAVIRTLSGAFPDHAMPLVVAEAGGRVTNLDGSALELEGRNILGSNHRLHRAMRETLAKAWPEAERREAEGRAAP